MSYNFIGGDFVCNGDFVPDINQQRDMKERMDNYFDSLNPDYEDLWAGFPEEELVVDEQPKEEFHLSPDDIPYDFGDENDDEVPF